MASDLTHFLHTTGEVDHLLARVNVAVMAIDGEGRVAFVNQEAAAVLRMTLPPTLDPAPRIAPEPTPEFDAMLGALEACVMRGEPVRRNTVSVGESESARTLGYSITPLFSENGDAEGAVAVFTDLTEVNALKRSAADADRFTHVRRVVSWMAHEVRNPLATIQMYAQLLGRSLGPDDREQVVAIRDQVTLAQTRISDLLRSLSFQSKETRRPAVTDLGAIAAEYVEREALALPHLRLRSEIGPGLHNVPLRPEDALSLVAHLVTNASQAMEGPGTAVVRVDSENAVTRLIVEDSGPGFPDEGPQRLVEPFFITKKRAPGLGLWAVKRICDRVAGGLSLDNTTEGGARVVVALPNLKLDDLRDKTILVVDDDETLRRLLSRQLNAFGAHTVDSAGATQAGEILSSQPVDAIVTDMNMPGGDGYTVLQRSPEHVPVLLISGQMESEIVQPQRPGVAFLMKPFSAEEFGLALSYVLWESELRTRGRTIA